MSEIILEVEKVPFTQVANDVLFDKRLSLQAKSVFAILRALGDTRANTNSKVTVSYEKLSSMNTNGIASIKTATAELKKYGFLTIEALRDKNGRVKSWKWTIKTGKKAEPVEEKPKQSKNRGKIIKHSSDIDANLSSQLNPLPPPDVENQLLAPDVDYPHVGKSPAGKSTFKRRKTIKKERLSKETLSQDSSLYSYMVRTRMPELIDAYDNLVSNEIEDDKIIEHLAEKFLSQCLYENESRIKKEFSRTRLDIDSTKIISAVKSGFPRDALGERTKTLPMIRRLTAESLIQEISKSR